MFSTFTRAGAYEARDRAVRRFGISPERFCHFRTLHSLCYQTASRGVISPGDWCAIGKLLGVGFSLRNEIYSEGIPRGSTRGDYLMSMWALARTSLIPLEQVHRDRDRWFLGMPDISFAELEHFAGTVKEYKEANLLLDFTDMLENFVADPTPFRVKYAIIDEAQDLSALQWKVVEKVVTHASEVHVAGDDDQCIHEWNGASPHFFISLQAESFRVLPLSYRIPASVHEIAERTIRQVPVRLEKTYTPREAKGQVSRVLGLEQIDMSKGSWLLLARNNRLLEQYADHCYGHGYAFSGLSKSKDDKIIHAIWGWNQLMAGKSITGRTAKIVYGYMSQRDRVRRGFKVLLAAVDDEKTFTLQDLKNDFGLVGEWPWTKALDLLDEWDRQFYAAVEKNEGLGATPRIDISTIHGAKGREAQNVVLCLDMSTKTWDAFQANPDQEHRVWYVGITRAKESLFILNPQSAMHYDL